MKKYVLSFIFGIMVITLLPAATVFAGEINDNESAVIAVISGYFELDGITYKITDEYIAMAQEYFNQDDVNLTAEQRDKAIAEIHNNVLTGVESGYLEPLETSLELMETQPESVVNNTNQESVPSNLSTNTEDVIEENSNSQLEEPELTIQEIRKHPVITMLEINAKDEKQIETKEFLSDENIPMIKTSILPAISYAIIGGLWGIFLVTLQISVRFHLFHHHKKQAKNYSKRRQVRTWISVCLTVIISVTYFLLAAGIALSISFFSEKEVLCVLQNSNYYERIYEDIITETELTLVLGGLPTGIAKETISYDSIVIAARQQAENDLSGGTYEANVQISLQKLKSGIQKYLEDEGLVLTEDAQLGLDNLMDWLKQSYSDRFRLTLADTWLSSKHDFMQVWKLILPAGILLEAVAVVVLVAIQHHKKKGFRYLAYGSFLTSLAVVVMTGLCLAAKPFYRMDISEGYIRDFYINMIISGMRNFLIINVIGLLIAAGIWGASKKRRIS